MVGENGGGEVVGPRPQFGGIDTPLTGHRIRGPEGEDWWSREDVQAVRLAAHTSLPADLASLDPFDREAARTMVDAYAARCKTELAILGGNGPVTDTHYDVNVPEKANSPDDITITTITDFVEGHSVSRLHREGRLTGQDSVPIRESHRDLALRMKRYLQAKIIKCFDGRVDEQGNPADVVLGDVWSLKQAMFNPDTQRVELTDTEPVLVESTSPHYPVTLLRAIAELQNHMVVSGMLGTREEIEEFVHRWRDPMARLVIVSIAESRGTDVESRMSVFKDFVDPPLAAADSTAIELVPEESLENMPDAVTAPRTRE